MGSDYIENDFMSPTTGVTPQNAQVLAWNSYRIGVQGDVITVNLNGIFFVSRNAANAPATIKIASTQIQARLISPKVLLGIRWPERTKGQGGSYPFRVSDK